MGLAYRISSLEDRMKDFLGINAGDQIGVRLINAPAIIGTNTPSTDFSQPTDPYYAPAIINPSDWLFSTTPQAVRALGPSVVFAFQGGDSIYGYWLYLGTDPDNWIIQVLLSEGPGSVPDTGGAWVVTPALQWYSGVPFTE